MYNTLLSKKETLKESNEGKMANKKSIYTISVQNDKDIETGEFNIDFVPSYNDQTLSNTFEPSTSELGMFLRDFTFTDDIIHKEREWL